jgi:hypothetical protein
MSVTLVPSELRYDQKNVVSADIDYFKIPPQQGPNIIVTASGYQQITFQLPAGRAWTPSKDYIGFQLTGIAPILATANFFYNKLPWDSIVISTQGGVEITRVTELPYMTSVCSFPSTRASKVEDKIPHSLAMVDTAGSSGGNTDTIRTGYFSMEGCHGASYYAGGPADQAPFGASERHNTGERPFMSNEPVRWVSSLELGPPNIPYDPMPLEYRATLSAIPGTFWKVNQTIVVPELIYITITFLPTAALGWAGPAPNEPAIGPITALPAVQYNVNNCYYYQHATNNRAVIEALDQKLQSGGLEVAYPYVTTQRLANLGGSIATNAFYINPGYGQYLQHVYTALFVNSWNDGTPRTPGLNHRYCHQNFFLNQTLDVSAPSVYTGIFTTFNGVKRNSYDYDTALAEDYLRISPYLEGSCIRNYSQFQHDSLWLDTWTNMRTADDDIVEGGIPLDSMNNNRFEFTARLLPTLTPQVTLMHFVFQLRKLIITSAGIRVL